MAPVDNPGAGRCAAGVALIEEGFGSAIGSLAILHLLCRWRCCFGERARDAATSGTSRQMWSLTLR